ncbi:hypothetical protein [Blastococcus sp. SYSU D00820]
MDSRQTALRKRLRAQAWLRTVPPTGWTPSAPEPAGRLVTAP